MHSSDRESSAKLAGKLYPKEQRGPSWAWQSEHTLICPPTHSIVTKRGLLKGPRPALEDSYL